VSPAPCPFIDDMTESFMFYGNKVMVEFKKTDTKHVDFVKAVQAVLGALKAYIKTHHTTGVSWNPKGAAAAAPAATAPAAAPKPASKPKFGGGAGGGGGGLFAAINAGGVTKGLKKVTADMQNHKNPTLKAAGTVPAKATPAAAAKKPAAAAAAAAPTRPPRKELEGKKWWVENFVGDKTIVVDDVNSKQTLFISRCTDSVVQVKGKINSICVDNCKKVGVVFESVVATVEVVNCKRVQLQCTGSLPSITLDKTDEAQLFLSKDCDDIVITTSLSSDINVSRPTGDDGDLKEEAIPYQFQTVIKDGALVTESVRHE